VRLVAVGLLAAVAAALSWLATREIFANAVFARRNYRGVDVPVGAGVLLAVAAIAVQAVLAVTDTSTDTFADSAVLVASLGFCLLGLVDDVAATGDDRGFRGHLRAMARGTLTTGGLKLAGGGLLALAVVSLTGEDRLGVLVLDALLIALSANVANLFDRAPGRTIKVGVVAAAALFATAGVVDRHLLVGVAAVVGAAVGLLAFDLREQLMVGDAGSNVIGSALGLGVVLTTAPATRVVVLIVVVAVNLASEKVSFSRVIDRVGPLRVADRLGRRPAR